MKNNFDRWFFIIIVFCFGVLVILGARAHGLWGDEAETAIYARNILKYGIPTGWDGVNLMGFREAVTLNSDLINYSNPWPQYYLAALSFTLFGESAFAARLPFIIISFFTLPLIFMIAKRIDGKRAGMIAVLCASFSVQYILFSFQARYYPLVTFFALVHLWTVLHLSEHKVWPFLLATVSGILFVYSNYLSFPIWYLSLGLAYGIYVYGVHKSLVWRSLILYVLHGGIIALGFAPWFYAFHITSRGTLNTGTVSSFIFNFPIWFWQISSHFADARFLPVGLVVVYWIAVWKSNRRTPLLYTGIFILLYVSFITAASMLTTADTSFFSSRIHAALLPVALIAVAVLVNRIWEWQRPVALGILFLFLFTNLPGRWGLRSDFVDYILEISQKYQTTDDAVASYISPRAVKGETAFVNLDRSHEPLIFLLKDTIRFVNRISLTNPILYPKNIYILPSYIYNFVGEPDWVILYGNTKDKHEIDYRPLPADINLAHYQEHVIPMYALDMSRPELSSHKFYPVKPGKEEMIYIYHKVKVAGSP